MSVPAPIWIDGPDGRLFAMWHAPALRPASAPASASALPPASAPAATRAAGAAVCVVMICGGTAVRFGPQRLYVKAAREWSRLGFHVLRIDAAGIGDAEAAADATSLDCHSARDVASAVGYARGTIGAAHVFLHGLCGGGRVIVRYAVGDPALAGLALWNMPVVSEGYIGGKRRGDAQPMSDARATQNLARLRTAVTRLDFLRPAWWRWVSRNGRKFTHEITGALRQRLRPERPRPSGFVDALSQVLARGTAVLNVYGDMEQVAIAELEQRFPALGRRLDERQTLRVVEGGNHTFNTLAAEAWAIAITGRWMRDVVGGAGGEP